MRLLIALILSISLPLAAEEKSAPPDPFKALAFLEGTWEANAKGKGGAEASGTYTFKRELRGHILSRESKNSSCKGPDDFNCEHSDRFFVYQDAPGAPLQAIYFDNEGHTIHYAVTTDGATATFLSDASHPGPQFRLVYELKDSLMTGRFQMRMPGQTAWNSYLEWSGAKK